MMVRTLALVSLGLLAFCCLSPGYEVTNSESATQVTGAGLWNCGAKTKTSHGTTCDALPDQSGWSCGPVQNDRLNSDSCNLEVHRFDPCDEYCSNTYRIIGGCGWF
ncbi:hypothetical protein Pan14r_46390 [Crateriforma conspicua]|uniref:Uncharacterized protein n=1 Tax=Crateriforma conspicua TaxID=2527996 RepID=A0A5C5YBG6_9PLAN|nr:hypothetical protein Pan14r_46390 [Crateriforma conspicua]